MLVEKIQALIEPVVQSLGLELWLCEFHGQGQYSQLRIYVDRDGKGASLEDCAQVSREVGALLDVEDCIKTRYELEVSSPGLERQLATLSHFSRYIGSMAKVKFRVPQNKHKTCSARIEKVEDNKIFFNIENEIVKVALGDIQKANLLLPITDNR